MKIGFIGVGAMGQPMLANLVKHGHQVLAYDVVDAALAGAIKAGATRAASSAAAARESELVITILPSSSHVESAYLGSGGVLEGIGAGRLCIDMSTIDPSVSRRVAGAVAKLCNNLVAGVAAVAVSEAFRIAEGFGVDPKVLTDVISKSSGNTWV